MAALSLNDSDLMYLLTLLRSSDHPLSTEEMVQALKQRVSGRS